MENVTRIAVLENAIEANLLEAVLNERGIPHMVRTYHDSVYDGLFQTQKGWGCIEAAEEHEEDILGLLAGIRAEAANATEAPDPEGEALDYDADKVDDMVLALLYLTTFDEGYGPRAWKGMDWDALDRLHQKGYIANPKSKAKSVALTEEGARRSAELFERFFGVGG